MSPPPSTEGALCPDSQQTVSDLYRAHHSWLTGWLRVRVDDRHDAADLAQDTFIRVLQSNVAATLREPRSYLATIARGLLIDLWRRRALEQAYLQVLESPTTVLVSYTVDVSGKIRVDVHYHGVQGLPELPVSVSYTHLDVYKRQS